MSYPLLPIVIVCVRSILVVFGVKVCVYVCVRHVLVYELCHVSDQRFESLYEENFQMFH